ncbi:MAG: hypothetical protein LC778_01635 [Acidobacteria bacterium]|nr:hypothetical protein [Acidobacteriota bacterium]
MSKCKPSVGSASKNLGITVEDLVTVGENPNRFVILKIPYEKLVNTPEISQSKISDLVEISIREEGTTGANQ